MFQRSGKGNYAYTSARAKAKKSRLLKEEDYSKMLMMSVPEISHYISEAGYSKEMTELGNRYTGLSLVEYATYANMAVAFRSILKASTGELRNMVEAYLSEWDFTNLEVILRGKNYGLPVEEIREDLVPAGRLDMDDLDDLVAAPGVEETLDLFASKTGVRVSDEAVAAYRNDRMLKDIEDELAKTFYRNLLLSVGTATQANRIFRTYIERVVDAQNVETLLKLKVERIGGEEAMKYFIPGGQEVDEKTYAQIAAAADVVSAGNEMQGLKIHNEIKGALTDNASVLDVVAAIDRYNAELANSVAHMYPLSVIPVVDYMIHKRNEARNIRMIAHGVDSGLDVETMKGLLVI